MVSSKHKKQNIEKLVIQQNDNKMLKNKEDAKNNITVESLDFPHKVSNKNKKRKHEKSENQLGETITNDLYESQTGSDTISKKKKKKSKSNDDETVINSNEVKENVGTDVDFDFRPSNKQTKKRQSGNTTKDKDLKSESINVNDSQNENMELSPIKKKKKNKKSDCNKEALETKVAITKNVLNKSQNDSMQENKKKKRNRKKRKNSETNTSENTNLKMGNPPKKKSKKEDVKKNSNENKNNRQRKLSEELPLKRQRTTSEESPVKVGQLNRNSEKSVIIENLPIKFMLQYKKTLRKHFEKCGEIVYLGKVQLFPNEEKNLKFSTIIVFKEQESVQKALEEDNLKFQDARIRVKTLPELVDSTIFVHSRSTLDQATLSTIFSPSGKISTILEVKHNTAFIQFVDPASVPRALTAATEAKVCGNSIVASRYKLRPQTESENEISVKEPTENKDGAKN